MSDLQKSWPPYIQNLALCVSLIRAGVGLNIKTLWKMKGPVGILSLGPVLCEWGVVSILMKYTLDLPWDLALAAGFMLAAVSPAIMIALCLDLERAGLGKERNVQGVLVGVTAIDALECIVCKVYTVFGILSAIALSSLKGASTWFGDPIVTAGLTVPLILIGGIALGTLFGYLFMLFKRCHWIVYLLVLSVASLTCLYTCLHFNIAGLAFIAILLWSIISVRSRSGTDVKHIGYVTMVSWRVVEVILFGLVGASLDINKLEGITVCYALLTIFIGVLVKFISSFFMSFIGPFTFKEKIYMALCRLPKATGQASLGGYVLARALAVDDDTYISYGRDIQTIAAISIMTTTFITLLILSLAPYLLPGKKVIQAVHTVVPTEEVKEEKELDSERHAYSFRHNSTHHEIGTE